MARHRSKSMQKDADVAFLSSNNKKQKEHIRRYFEDPVSLFFPIVNSSFTYIIAKGDLNFVYAKQKLFTLNYSALIHLI